MHISAVPIISQSTSDDGDAHQSDPFRPTGPLCNHTKAYCENHQVDHTAAMLQHLIRQVVSVPIAFARDENHWNAEIHH